MSPDLDALLCSRYPTLFAKRSLAMTQSAMHWGFSCGDGWFDLIDDLCAKLQAAVAAGEIPQPVAEQVKQKFGVLRFYLSVTRPEARTLIDEAERRSSVTCEICGQPGVLRRYAGVKTLCAVHGGTASVVTLPTRSV